MRRCTRRLVPAAGIAVLLACGTASGAVSEVSATGFTITLQRDVAVSPARLYQALGQIGQWWSKDHTWSGTSANLSIDLAAGGCFCERWGGNSVEHARVLFAAPDRMLRLSGALGPMQALPVTGILTFEIVGAGNSSRLRVAYAVAGGGTDLTQLAQPVDGVITEQVDRLVAFAVR